MAKERIVQTIKRVMLESSKDLEDLIGGHKPMPSIQNFNQKVAMKIARAKAGLPSSNHWELFDTDDGSHFDANMELDKAWDHAKSMPVDDAIRHMHGVMDKHNDHGAADSEGHIELAKRVQDHFGHGHHDKARYRYFGNKP